MKAKTFALSLAAASTLMVPVGVSALAAGRVVAPIDEPSELSSGSSVLVGVFAAAAVIAGIVIASGGSDDDLPVSG
jgi:hypothetical protein